MTANHPAPRSAFLLAAVVAACVAFSGASTLTGTVTNGTSGKPSSGDAVILIKLAAGMEEVGHTKTDALGKFAFNVPDGNSPYLVRAIHQEVTYHAPAPPGSNSVTLTVYDVAAKVEGVKAVADLMSVQAGQGKLSIDRVFAVDNGSKPARTEMNDAPFEFYIPEAAEIDEAQAQTVGGQPVIVSPVPQAVKGRYALVFPLRPGETQFHIAYHMNYSGKATVDPHLIYPIQHLVVFVPKSMTFSPSQAGVYESREAPKQPDTMVAIVADPKPGQKLSFEISGEGSMPNQDQSSSSAGSGGAGDTRPGGGLGVPNDAPDPLDKYRWYILGEFGIALVGGALYIVQRSRSVRVTSSATPASARQAANLAAPAVLAPVATSSYAGMFFQGLKEEMFQLELDHKQSKISDEEYAKTKSALDQTLSRALKRSQ